MTYSSKGACLCGGVQFTAEAESEAIGLCHCKMCRRWSGGMPLTAMHAKVTLHAEDTLEWWGSSSWGERGFCRQCGSSLFWRLRGDEGNSWTVMAGALEEDGALHIKEHIFYDDKAGFYNTTDDAPRHSGAEFTARVLKGLAAQHGEAAQKQALAQLRESAGDDLADAVEKLL